MLSLDPTLETSLKLPIFSGMVNRLPMFLPSWKSRVDVSSATNKFGTVLFSGGVLTQRHRDILDFLTYFYNAQKVKTDAGYVGRIYFSEFDLLNRSRDSNLLSYNLGGYYWNNLHKLLHELASVSVTVDLRDRIAACNPKTDFAGSTFLVGPILTTYSQSDKYGKSYVEFSPKFFHLLASDICLFSSDPVYTYLLSNVTSPIDKAVLRYVLTNDKIRIRMENLLDAVCGEMGLSAKMKRRHIHRLVESQFNDFGLFFNISIGANGVLNYVRDSNKIATAYDATLSVNTRIRLQQYMKSIRELSVIKKPVCKYQVRSSPVHERYRLCQKAT